jgi:cytochrome c-type biogenesis protein
VFTGAITADPLGVLVAFGAGVLSFLSPCVLPLVPGYLSLVSGLSAADLGTSKPRRGEAPVAERELALVGAAGQIPPPAPPLPVAPPSRPRPLAPLLRGILLFIAGFTVVFVALGATASGVGHLLTSHKGGLITVSGAVVVVLGVVMLASSLPAGVWSRLGPKVAGTAGWLVGERRFHVRPRTLGSWAAPVMGMAFAFAWTPCIGPVLGAVLALTVTRSTLGGGVLLLFAYSLGLGVPFLVTGLAFDRLTSFYARARKPLAVVQVLAGMVLVAFGAILLAGDLGWLSAQFSSLLDHLGLQRLTVS